MPGDNEDVTLEEVYAECDKRIAAAVAAAIKQLDDEGRLVPAKKPFSIKRTGTS